MVAQKCKNIWFQATLKEFSSSANPNVKKLNFIKTATSSGPYWIKCKSREFRGVTFIFKWIKIFLHSAFSNKSLTWRCAKIVFHIVSKNQESWKSWLVGFWVSSYSKMLVPFFLSWHHGCTNQFELSIFFSNVIPGVTTC